MADVTISQLTRGTPLGNSLLPYSSSNNTQGVPVSGLFQTVADNLYINTTPVAIPGKGIVLSSNDASGTSIFLNNQTLNKSWRLLSTGSANTGGGSRFGILNHTDDPVNYKLVILSGGEVGVGTNSPAATLDVNGSLFTKGYNHIESASLNITSETQTRIYASNNDINSSYLQFGLTNRNNSTFISNNNVFEIINSAPYYGLKIKKTGVLKIDVIQDVISAQTSNYVQLWIYKNNIVVGRHLIRPTNGSWDSITASQIITVSANDVITMTINCHTAGQITSIDATDWSYYNFMFWS